MFSRLLGFFGGKGITTYIMIALGVSLAANAAMGYLYKEALQDTARVEIQALLDEALRANRTAYSTYTAALAARNAQVTELQNRLLRSDQVMREHADRAAASQERLSAFEETLGARAMEDPSYESWSNTPLPGSIAEGLQSLAERPLQVEE